MARYKSNIKIKGTVNGMTFRQTPNGSIVSGKTGPTSEQVLGDPRFEKTRKMYEEFARACNGARMFRALFKDAIDNCYDRKMHQRLVGVMRRIINSDTISQKGERNLLMGDCKLLKGFEWNMNSRLANILGMNYRVDVDRKSGEVAFHFPSFTPALKPDKNETATHCRITAAVAELTWREDGPFTAMHTTEYLKLNEKIPANFGIVLLVNEGTERPIASSLSITWYQEVNGMMYQMQNAGYNAGAVVEVD